MNIKIKTIFIVGFFLIMVLSSSSLHAKFPKSISEDIWVDGTFNGEILFGELNGDISGLINLGRSSSRGVFQSTILLDNKSYESRGWFREKLLFGFFKKDTFTFPLIGIIDKNQFSFNVRLIIPEGVINSTYKASYLPPLNGKYDVGVKEYHIIDESR